MSLQECQLRAEAEWLESWQAGPSRLRWDRVPIQVGDRAPEVRVLDIAGGEVGLEQIWSQGRPALILFWRHYGCGCGLDRNRRLVQELADYREAGAIVVIVGQGDPEQAAAYAERYEVPVPIFSDLHRQAYRAFDVLEGQPCQIFFDAGQDLLRRDQDAGRQFAMARRGAGRAPVNSPWQLPAEFVIGANGVVCLAYRYQHCEDFPEPRMLLAAISEARRVIDHEI